MMKKTLILSLMLVVSSVLFAVTIADANVGEVAVVENPQAVVDLVERIGGKGASNKFVFVLDPTKNPTQEEFTIAGAKGKVLISGNTLSAITTGLGWYLQNYAHINIAWNSLNEKTATGEAYTRLSRLPVPSFAETQGISDASKPITSSISFFTSSTRALGKSILLITGKISKSFSIAKYTFASVCASTPCVASTTKIAPSQAASERLTS